ncbi:hypothetical protein ACFL59_03990 [Planctomycetota bacterium]
MCGIFGLVLRETTALKEADLQAIMRDLFLLSESRGKEASGLATLTSQDIEVLRSPISASSLVKTGEYAQVMRRAVRDEGRPIGNNGHPGITIIGHSRLVTTGTQYAHSNNQPVIANQTVGIHNGIVVNHDSLWSRHTGLQRSYEVDSEVIFALLRMHFDSCGSIVEATRNTFREIEGMSSIAVLFADLDVLLLATNNGSLYTVRKAGGGALAFASEGYILRQLLRRPHGRRVFGRCAIEHVAASEGCQLDTSTLATTRFEFGTNARRWCRNAVTRRNTPRGVLDLNAVTATRAAPSGRAAARCNGAGTEKASYLRRIADSFPQETRWAESLRRCSRCVLPESMPFIEFDDRGVCSFCRSYRRLEFRGHNRLEEVIAPHRRGQRDPDCVVGISGGRDSLYSLHYTKNILRMNPVAYTYDWGMVTDLARRNISRICGKLGVEHILVSADITRKRTFVRKNVVAWLRRPDLGIVPLFMAGDKQYFYFLRKVRRQVGASLSVLGENMLERTDFKTGFAGVPPARDRSHVYTLPKLSKVRLASYYAKEYLLNPSYLNVSLIDTALASACYYLLDRDYINLYSYIPWIEEEVVDTLRQEYDFELASDTTTTWRIGDGTAAFYNYIYYTMAGFTEHDTLRSNQIREGLITREEALRRVRDENRPRFESIHWYLKTIGLEEQMEDVLRIIRDAPRRQPRA